MRRLSPQLAWVALSALVAGCAPKDPAPGMAHAKTWARGLSCERLTVEAANRRYPGEIAPSPARGDLYERSAVICREDFLDAGVRSARDEAILRTLEASTAGLAEAAASLRPDLADRIWLVEAYDPSAEVAEKVAFATKNALMRRGLGVSDRSPLLGAGDVEVLVRLPPDEAYPAACRRYADTGSLGEGDALLAIVRRDPRETALHAGICDAGRWSWLR